MCLNPRSMKALLGLFLGGFKPFSYLLLGVQAEVRNLEGGAISWLPGRQKIVE